MKLKLIEPKVEGFYLQHTEKEVKSLWFAHLSLASVAALTPRDVEVSLTDENVEEIDFEEDVDLVGLTAMTTHAPRAYEIAAHFKSKGVPVVMGGIHASLLPHEAKKYVDSVVVGEAEEVWGNLIGDFREGKLKPFYKADKPPSLKGLPHPRRDLFKKEAYNTINCIQTSRGCPYNCEFCSVTQFFGNTFRSRPIDEVIEEIKTLSGKFFIFVDDNLVGNPRYAKELFRKLIPLNLTWGSQANLTTLAKDNELLRLAKESGCTSMFVGIETLSKDNLKLVNKNFNRRDEYEDLMKKIQDHGITLIASFIFGLDHDDPGVFERTVRFCEKNRIDLPTYYILTPLPGTSLFQRMEQEGRILHKDWSKYNGSIVVYKPNLMSEETLQNGFYWACRETYSYNSIFKRLRSFPERYIKKLILNIAYRRLAMRVPKSSLSPLSKILQRIPVTVTIKNKKDLLPSFEIMPLRLVSEKASNFFRIHALSNERLKTLILTLEGSLDLKGAEKLINSIKLTLKRGIEKVIIDFKEVNFLSPKAITFIISEISKKFFDFKGKIEVVNINDKIERVLMNLKGYFEEIKVQEEY